MMKDAEDGCRFASASSISTDRKAVCHAAPNSYPWVDPGEVTRRHAARARQLKCAHARAGFVSQSDVLYWSLEILRGYPRLARALAGRFDELIVDEAQDTSDVQLACLELLHSTGRLRSLMVVADLEQSIYAFHGAFRNGSRASRKTLDSTQSSRDIIFVHLNASVSWLVGSHDAIRMMQLGRRRIARSLRSCSDTATAIRLPR